MRYHDEQLNGAKSHSTEQLAKSDSLSCVSDESDAPNEFNYREHKTDLAIGGVLLVLFLLFFFLSQTVPDTLFADVLLPLSVFGVCYLLFRAVLSLFEE